MLIKQRMAVVMGCSAPNEYYAFVPFLPGCWACDTTPEKTHRKIREAAEQCMKQIERNPDLLEQLIKIVEATEVDPTPGLPPEKRMLYVLSRQMETADRLGLNPLGFIHDLYPSLVVRRSGRGGMEGGRELLTFLVKRDS